ncbi:WhiB family transcriptional regulator [Nocardiopsis dassonvillei]|uniref:WhiB family transcriptional regulator n=1 Tax=Nocardiopsis dassonvillei TaxID=2014 RepID=UPI00200E0D79|nr:WhiB family transcriptional regulator [Nocardiopsis dassonvillei]MCK9872968.1 WhiB family transcriptional regulator [Nocardiopsis dassonvillei]
MLLPPDALDEAACARLPARQVDRLFFSAHTGPQRQAIRELCRPCPARTRCLANALALRIDLGVAGGATAAQRSRITSHLPDPVAWPQVVSLVGDDWDQVEATRDESARILTPGHHHLHTGDHDGLRTHLDAVRDGAAGPWAELSFQSRAWVVAHLVHLDRTRQEAAELHRWQDHLDRAARAYRSGGLAAVRATPDLARWLSTLTARGDLPLDMRMRLFAIGADLLTPAPDLLHTAQLHLLDQIMQALREGADDAAVRTRFPAAVGLVARAGLESLSTLRYLLVAQDATGPVTVDALCARYPLARDRVVDLLRSVHLPVVHAAPGAAEARACPGRARTDRLAQDLADGDLPAWVQTLDGRQRADRQLALHGYPTVPALIAHEPHPTTTSGQTGRAAAPTAAGAGR